MFNIRSVQNTDCRMHYNNVQNVLSKFTTLGKVLGRLTVGVSKLDQNHAAQFLILHDEPVP